MKYSQALLGVFLVFHALVAVNGYICEKCTEHECTRPKFPTTTNSRGIVQERDVGSLITLRNQLTNPIHFTINGAVGTAYSPPSTLYQSSAVEGGVNVTILDNVVVFRQDVENNGWAGNFALNERILVSPSGPKVDLLFNEMLSAFVVQIQQDLYGEFTAEIAIYADSNFETLLDSVAIDSVATANEDDTAVTIGIESTLGFVGVRLSVVSQLSFGFNRFEVVKRCGNGVVDIGEDCDDNNLNNMDTCTNICQSPRCGDGFLQPGEECDDGNEDDTDYCTNSCTSNCMIPQNESKCVLNNFITLSFPTPNNYGVTFVFASTESDDSRTSFEIYHQFEAAIFNEQQNIISHWNFDQSNPLILTVDLQALPPNFRVRYLDENSGVWKNGERTCQRTPVNNGTHINYYICHLTTFGLVSPPPVRESILEWGFRFTCGSSESPRIQGHFGEVIGVGNKNEYECERLTVGAGRETTACIPSQFVPTQITLRRILSKDDSFWAWRDQVANGDLQNARTQCSLVLFDRSYRPVIEYTLHNAWPASVSIVPVRTNPASRTDLLGRRALFEEIVIIHEGIYTDNQGESFEILDN